MSWSEELNKLFEPKKPFRSVYNWFERELGASNGLRIVFLRLGSQLLKDFLFPKRVPLSKKLKKSI
jgi:hypothetical protein